jgi:hypothetical protein
MGLPTVSTIGYVYNIADDFANCNGLVSDDGGNSVTDRGICWNTTGNPTLTDDSHSIGTGVGEFVGNASDLLADTVYYVRAYATNTDGTSYADEVFTFQTLDAEDSDSSNDGIKLTTEFYDINGSKFTIDIYRHAYTDEEYAVKYNASQPVKISHGGGDKNSLEETVVQGQTLDFSFYILREDVSLLDYLLESQYQDYVLEYKDSSGNLVFKGYIKPENLTKRYETNLPYIEVKLPATDGLADLSFFEFKDADDELIIGDYTILDVIKFALRPIIKTNVLDFDFKIQLGTYEAELMTSIECALKRITVNTQSFVDGELTENKTINCLDVIERVLKPFNVLFKQDHGFYYITNYHELDSFEFTFDWATLTQQSRLEMGVGVSSNVVDASNYLYTPYVEQQKIHPLKYSYVNHLNSLIEDDLLADVDWADWTITGFDSQTIEGDKLKIVKIYQTSDDTEPYIQTPSFYVPKVKDAQFLHVKFTFVLNKLTYTTSDGYYFKIELGKISGDSTIWNEPSYITIDADKATYPMVHSTDFENSFRIIQDGYYVLRISVYLKDTNVRGANYEFRDISIKIAEITNQTVAESRPSIAYGRRRGLSTGVTRGRVNRATNEIRRSTGGVSTGRTGRRKAPTKDRRFLLKQTNGYETFETDLHFADGINEGNPEAGAFAIDESSGTFTSVWNSYGRVENAPLIFIYAKNVINNRRQYKNYLRCNVKDRGHIIRFKNILLIQDKYYVISEYSRDYRNGNCDLGLIELLTTQLSYDIIEEVPTDSLGLRSTSIPPLEDVGEYQEVHDFEVGNVVRYDFTAKVYVKAQANTPENAKAVGIVSEVLTEDRFKFLSGETIRSDSQLYTTLKDKYSLEVGEYYFLSPDTPGALIKSTQLTGNDVEQCVGYVTTKGLKVQINARNIPPKLPTFPRAGKETLVQGDNKIEFETPFPDGTEYILWTYTYDDNNFQIGSRIIEESDGSDGTETGFTIYASKACNLKYTATVKN